MGVPLSTTHSATASLEGITVVDTTMQDISDDGITTTATLPNNSTLRVRNMRSVLTAAERDEITQRRRKQTHLRARTTSNKKQNQQANRRNAVKAAGPQRNHMMDRQRTQELSVPISTTHSAATVANAQAPQGRVEDTTMQDIGHDITTYYYCSTDK